MSYDVFISYNRQDVVQVRELDAALRSAGLHPYLDTNDVPGEVFHDRVASVLQSVAAAVIAIGPFGFGKWQELEIRACVEQHVQRKLRIVPALLPGTVEASVTDPFLRSFNWLNLPDHEGIRLLAWAVTGQRAPLTESQVLVAAETEHRSALEAAHPLTDAWEAAIIKERLHHIAVVIAQYAAEQADVVAMLDKRDEVARLIPMIVEFRWRRGYAAGLAQLLRRRGQVKRLKSFDISEVTPLCDRIDGMLSASTDDPGLVVVCIDGVPALKVNVGPGSDRAAIIAAIDGHGRLGAPDVHGASLLERVGEIIVSSDAETEDGLTTALWKNRELLAVLVARHGLASAQWIMSEDEITAIRDASTK